MLFGSSSPWCEAIAFSATSLSKYFKSFLNEKNELFTNDEGYSIATYKYDEKNQGYGKKLVNYDRKKKSGENSIDKSKKGW